MVRRSRADVRRMNDGHAVEWKDDRGRRGQSIEVEDSTGGTVRMREVANASKSA